MGDAKHRESHGRILGSPCHHHEPEVHRTFVGEVIKNDLLFVDVVDDTEALFLLCLDAVEQVNHVRFLMVNTAWMIKGTSQLVQLVIVHRRLIYKALDTEDQRISIRGLMGKPLIPFGSEMRKGWPNAQWFIYLNFDGRPAIAPMKPEWGQVLAEHPDMCQTPSRIRDLQSFLELTS